ncbi:MAG: chloride channel protein [Eubacterium sp.]|nr:chloride channel protein [Eubacterium sp.]
MRMTDRIIENIKHIFAYIKTIIKWLFFATIAGVSCGAVGTLFHYCVDMATVSQQKYPYLLYFLPIAGLCIVGIYRLNGVKKDEGTNLILTSVQSCEDVPANMTVLIFISTFLTHLCGGSAGREGAALQIGGSMGSLIGRLFKLEPNEKRIIVMCGMSALFSALFGTPLTAAVFSMEVISVGVMNYAAFLPCVVSAVIAVKFAEFFGVEPMAFDLAYIPDMNIKTAVLIGLLALGCSAVSAIFVRSLQLSGKLFAKYIENGYLRTFCGGCAVILLTLICGSRMFCGAGMDTIELALSGRVVWYAFIMKIIFTAVTIGSGFKGGEIIPSFFIGATFGNAIGALLGIDPVFGAAIGMVSVFCGVVNCPMASVLLSVELFGSAGILFFALSCAICYIASGYYSLYAAQNFVYSKLPLAKTDTRKFSKNRDEWKKLIK